MDRLNLAARPTSGTVRGSQFAIVVESLRENGANNFEGSTERRAMIEGDVSTGPSKSHARRLAGDSASL